MSVALAGIMLMRLTIFSVTLTVMATRSCQQQQQQQCHTQAQLQDTPCQLTRQRASYHNISIMQEATEAEIPVPLQHAIAACCSIIRDFFSQQTNSFMLSTHVQNEKLSRLMRDFLNQVLLCLNMIKVEIENIHGNRVPSFNRKYNLIVVDGPESLRQLNPANLSRDYDIQEHYLLYFMWASRFANMREVMDEMFAYFWDNYIINVSIIEVNEQVVEAFTYYPFHDHLLCKTVYVEMINSFRGTWSRPMDQYMFPEKLENLQRCPLAVAVWNTPPYLSYQRSASGFYEIAYFEADMLHVLAEKLNFTFDLKEPPHNEQRGKVLADGTVTGALKMLRNRTADISLGSFRYTNERAEILTAAVPYYQTWQIFGMLRTSKPYTSLQILIYAFDEKTWICIALSIQMAIVLAYIAQCYYSSALIARNVIGLPRTAEALTNILGIFMGVSLSHLPTTNFTRFVIVFWFIYGLLLRTVYTSLLFQLLQGNLFHSPPSTLTGLIDEGCTLVTTEATFDSVKTVPRIEAGMIAVIKIRNTSEQSTFFYVERNGDAACLAGIAPKDFLTYHVNKERKWGMFYIVPEMIFTQHITAYFSKHSFLINRFNFLFMNLRSMGMIDYWARQSLDESYLDGKREHEFKPISLKNLRGVFLIYFILILMNLLVFGLEFAVFRLRIRFGKLRYAFMK